MTLPKTTLDREFQKFRDTNEAGKTKVAVVLEQEESVPVSIVDELGTPFNLSGATQTSQGVEVDIINTTLANAVNLKSFKVSCSIEGIAYFRVNGTIKGSARTSAGKPDAEFDYDSTLPLLASDQIKLSFMARLNSKQTDVEGYLQGSQI